MDTELTEAELAKLEELTEAELTRLEELTLALTLAPDATTAFHVVELMDYTHELVGRGRTMNNVTIAILSFAGVE